MHAIMATYFSIKRTNRRAHAAYALEADLSQDKRIGIKRTCHRRFFDIFLLLLYFKGSTCLKVLSDR